MLLSNKVALITGAARGIGASCVEAFAKNGASTLILIDTDESNGEKIAASFRGICDCLFMMADVSDETQVLQVFNSVKERFGRLDILVNVAGICSTKTLFEADLNNWDRLMDINLRSVLLFSREALKLMIQQKYGLIVNLASIAGQVGGIRTSPAYAASKDGIICLTKSLAKFAAKDGVTVNALSPGLVDTDMTRDPGFHYSLSEIPMGRVARPKEIADVALFLASDLSRYITGQCINVNGGMYMA